MFAPDTPPLSDDGLLAALGTLVLKQGVAVGGLSDAQRPLALGLVWAGLPRGVLDERGVNAALQSQLAGAARCLAIDHVELRRWLCDSGWLQRDAWGREYRRQGVAALPESLRSLGAALERVFVGGATAEWAAGRRAAHEAARAARRRAHEGAADVAGPPAP
jgi:hypothetical protein